MNESVHFACGFHDCLNIGKDGQARAMVEWDHEPMPEQPSMTELDLADLARAKKLLENPGFIAKAADAVGTPIEKLLHALPEKASTAIQTATRTALEKALK